MQARILRILMEFKRQIRNSKEHIEFKRLPGNLKEDSRIHFNATQVI